MTLTIGQAKPGMQLAKPVVNPQGRVLFKPDVELTEKHLKTLKAWGITEVTIKGTEGSGQAASAEKRVVVIDDQIRKQITHEVDYLFQKTDKADPVVKELYRLAIRNKLSQKTGHLDG